MSRELTQKVIEAGLVPTHAIRQLKVWRQLPTDLPEEEKQRLTQEQLLGFVSDIENLLEVGSELPELRETIPGVETAFDSSCQEATVVVTMPYHNVVARTLVLLSKVYRSLIFRAENNGELIAQVGNQVSLGDGKVHEITGVTPLYSGEATTFYSCTTQEVPHHAQVPELQEFGTKL